MRAALSFLHFLFSLTKNLMLGVRVASSTAHPKKIIVSCSTCGRRVLVVHDAGGGTYASGAGGGRYVSGA
jgi:hypothetical protein